MGVDHGGIQILVAEDLLETSDVVAPGVELGSEGVTEFVEFYPEPSLF